MLSPLWLTDSYLNPTGASPDDNNIMTDPSQLQWEFDEERGRMYVTYPEE